MSKNLIHLQVAYGDLQEERNALHEANDILDMLVEKAYKEGYTKGVGAKEVLFAATHTWIGSE